MLQRGYKINKMSVLTLVLCVPTPALAVLGPVEVLLVMVDVSWHLGGLLGGCDSDCRAAAEIN